MGGRIAALDQKTTGMPWRGRAKGSKVPLAGVSQLASRRAGSESHPQTGSQPSK